jgi:replicative DNA helicase
MARGTCRCCKNDFSINADGTIRYHLAADPECQESPGSRKCRGVGKTPEGTEENPPGLSGYVCRIPAGPTGCGRVVELTANGRARSHLDPQGRTCAGGSDWPLAVDAQGNRTDTRPQGEILPAARPEDLRIEPGPDDWKTPLDLLAEMPGDVQRTAALNPECWECGHEVTPLVDRFDMYGRPEGIVWSCSDNWRCRVCGPSTGGCRPQLIAQDRLANLDEGALFVRHTARPPLNGLVYRVQAVTAFCVQATVVSAGAHAGRTGELTDLSEEITCTDLEGKPRPRRDAPTPSRPVPTTPAPTTAPRSRPSSTASAPQPSVTGTGAYGPGTTSGPMAKAAGSTPSARKKTDVADAFSTPKAALKESDKYDTYGRYKILHPDSSKRVNWTRATTFCKSIQDTFALSMWAQRMTLKGASLRSDLVAAAGTLEVKADKDRMNGLVDEAKKAAGDKVAANKGTAVHSYTEDRDRAAAGLPVKDRAVPEEFVPTVHAYEAILADFGLRPVPGLIEFTTAVKQYEVAGTADRVYQVTRDITIKLNGRPVTLYSGEYVIGDVKGLALTERIPTPDGWTTMGEVQVGDLVFDAYGKPCRVMVKSKTKRIGTYIVRFDDGSSVTCDAEHIWWTSTGTRPGEPTAKSIQEVIATLRDARTGSAHHRVPVAGPLELPEADLPIDPYLLGCWLGDGHRRGDTITKGRDLFEILESDGHVLGVEQKQKGDCVSRSVKGLRAALRAEGLQFNKHIPAVYLRSSVEQRTALLRGLMDTDGCWNTARKTAEFSTTDKETALQVEELLLSLGQRPHLSDQQCTGFGVTVTAYRVAFTPVNLQPFRLPRKADQAAVSTKPVTRSTRRVIVSVEPGPDVETACIGVDAPTHTYLAGDRMIPTHNTGADLSYAWQEIAIQLALYSQGLNTSGVWSWEGRTWARPEVDGVQIQVRTDVGIVPHLPVDREETGAPLATLYAVDLTAGWAAAVLCGQVRSWRKERTLATPLEVADVAEGDPDTDAPVSALTPPVSRPQAASRPVTLKDKARAVTSRPEASAVFQEAVAARLPVTEVKELVQIMQDKLKSFQEKGA